MSTIDTITPSDGTTVSASDDIGNEKYCIMFDAENIGRSYQDGKGNDNETKSKNQNKRKVP